MEEEEVAVDEEEEEEKQVEEEQVEERRRSTAARRPAMVMNTRDVLTLTHSVPSHRWPGARANNIELFWNLYDAVISGSRIVHDVVEGVGAVSSALQAIDAWLDTSGQVGGSRVQHCRP